MWTNLTRFDPEFWNRYYLVRESMIMLEVLFIILGDKWVSDFFYFLLTRSSFGTTRRILNSTWTSLFSWRKFFDKIEEDVCWRKTGLSTLYLTLWSFVLQWNYFKWNQIIDYWKLSDIFLCKSKKQKWKQRNTEKL